MNMKTAFLMSLLCFHTGNTLSFSLSSIFSSGKDKCDSLYFALTNMDTRLKLTGAASAVVIASFFYMAKKLFDKEAALAAETIPNYDGLKEGYENLRNILNYYSSYNTNWYINWRDVYRHQNISFEDFKELGYLTDQAGFFIAMGSLASLITCLVLGSNIVDLYKYDQMVKFELPEIV